MGSIWLALMLITIVGTLLAGVSDLITNATRKEDDHA